MDIQYRQFGILAVILFVMISYNNCSPYHTMESTAPSFLPQTDLPSDQETFFEGASLYKVNCAQCHGPIETSTKRNVSYQRIVNALEGVPQMRPLQSLDDKQIEMIRVALNDSASDNLNLACESAPDVGTVAMHRLNQFEYRNTIASLTGVTLAPDSSFPTEEAADFPNNAAKLTTSKAQLEWYLKTAISVANQVLNTTALKNKLIGCDLNIDMCRAATLQSFSEKAYRRPPSESELQRIIQLVESQIGSGSSSQEATEVGFAAIMTSPQFLYRNINLENPLEKNVQQKLSPRELATRISYFIWGDVPDDILLTKSLSGELNQKTMLDQEIERMLKDPRAINHLSKNFFSYWFGVHQFVNRTPSQEKFPEFTSSIQNDMIVEAELFFKSIIKNNRSLADVLTQPETYLNRNLANFYGVSGDFNNQFKKVDLSTSGRVGALTLGSVLTNTSHSTGTSIVRRGSFIALNLQCIEIDTPPDGISPLPPPNGSDSVRKRLEAHRSNPQCMGCHSVMDPPGFGLENFNAIGKSRTTDDEGFPLDTQGTLYNGKTFNSAEELAYILSGDRSYQRCAIKKLTTFAIGRSLEKFDECTIEKIVNNVGDRSLREVIVEIILSDTFQYERGG